LLAPDGTLQCSLLERAEELVAKPGAETTVLASAKPIKLPPFRSELVLRDGPNLAMLADGLYRPHKMTVVDDPETPTRFFALDNYFGARARVLVYGAGGASLWRHGEWE
jgi:hypothetical protein